MVSGIDMVTGIDVFTRILTWQLREIIGMDDVAKMKSVT